MDHYVFCDESSHLLKDKKKAMVLGAVVASKEKRYEAYKAIRAIKTKHNLNEKLEIKWTKVTGSRVDFYKEIVNYFFDNPDLSMRMLVATDKFDLRHTDFNQDHDTWYFKMYFTLLKPLLGPSSSLNIFLDIKDTISGNKVKLLYKYLLTHTGDGVSNQHFIKTIQLVHSHEVELTQLIDIFIGAVAYIHNTPEADYSKGKRELIELIKSRSNLTFLETTSYTSKKINLLIWKPIPANGGPNGAS